MNVFLLTDTYPTFADGTCTHKIPGCFEQKYRDKRALSFIGNIGTPEGLLSVRLLVSINSFRIQCTEFFLGHDSRLGNNSDSCWKFVKHVKFVV